MANRCTCGFGIVQKISGDPPIERFTTDPNIRIHSPTCPVHSAHSPGEDDFYSFETPPVQLNAPPSTS